ncbi:hypothetical protein O181_029340 [Austropuccinia psidii MF-1]|uniref:Uncharacterized protein n=1 Tax=Austropuccinia psidii MF-1 TaxID=1389203 RepID=A0A9Q3H537_9BASI|nr:hypothetical protein [Austropuccinia psidii MF-1]
MSNERRRLIFARTHTRKLQGLILHALGFCWLFPQSALAPEAGPTIDLMEKTKHNLELGLSNQSADYNSRKIWSDTTNQAGSSWSTTPGNADVSHISSISSGLHLEHAHPTSGNSGKRLWDLTLWPDVSNEESPSKMQKMYMTGKERVPPALRSSDFESTRNIDFPGLGDIPFGAYSETPWISPRSPVALTVQRSLNDLNQIGFELGAPQGLNQHVLGEAYNPNTGIYKAFQSNVERQASISKGTRESLKSARGKNVDSIFSTKIAKGPTANTNGKQGSTQEKDLNSKIALIEDKPRNSGVELQEIHWGNPDFPKLDSIQPVDPWLVESDKEKLFGFLAPLGLSRSEVNIFGSIQSYIDELALAQCHGYVSLERWSQKRNDIWTRIESLLQFILCMNMKALKNIEPSSISEAKTEQEGLQAFIYERILKPDHLISLALDLKASPESSQIPRLSHIQVLLLKYLKFSLNDYYLFNVKASATLYSNVSKLQILKLELALLCLEYYYKSTDQMKWNFVFETRERFWGFWAKLKNDIQMKNHRDYIEQISLGSEILKIFPWDSKWPPLDAKLPKHALSPTITDWWERFRGKVLSIEKFQPQEYSSFISKEPLLLVDDWLYQFINLSPLQDMISLPRRVKQTIYVNGKALQEVLRKHSTAYDPTLWPTAEKEFQNVKINRFKSLFLRAAYLNSPFLAILGAGLPPSHVEHEQILIQNWMLEICLILKTWKSNAQDSGNDRLFETTSSRLPFLFAKLWGLERNQAMQNSSGQNYDIQSEIDKITTVIALNMLYYYYKLMNPQKWHFFYETTAKSMKFTDILAVSIHRLRNLKVFSYRPLKGQNLEEILPWNKILMNGYRPGWLKELSKEVHNSIIKLKYQMGILSDS